MIRGPVDEAEKAYCHWFLEGRGIIGLSPSAHFLMMESGGAPSWIVAYDGWVGKTCQMHMASRGGVPVPRGLAFTAFHYAFKVIGRELVFALVNSLNPRALKIDLWLGFREVYRAPQCHEGGGDLVLLQLRKADWIARSLENGKKRATCS